VTAHPLPYANDPESLVGIFPGPMARRSSRHHEFARGQLVRPERRWLPEDGGGAAADG
jgi:hypothetical protein